MSYSLASLKPKFLPDLVRVGASRDGGYVVNDRAVKRAKFLLSFGINDEWSFEEDFLKLNPSAQVFCFDHSISATIFRNKLVNAINEILSPKFVALLLSFNAWSVRQKFWAVSHWATVHKAFRKFTKRPNVHFAAKGISNEASQQFVTFEEAFSLLPQANVGPNSVFIKMDIEQSEYRVLSDLANFEEYICSLIVEFHDLDILWSRFVDLTSQLKDRFEITHIHGNNYGGVIPQTGIPRVVEITFLKRDLIPEVQRQPESVTYPISHLDYPNNPNERDYPLVF